MLEAADWLVSAEPGKPGVRLPKNLWYEPVPEALVALGMNEKLIFYADTYGPRKGEFCYCEFASAGGILGPIRKVGLTAKVISDSLRDRLGVVMSGGNMYTVDPPRTVDRYRWIWL